MKLFEYIKGDNEKIVKLLGFTLMEQAFDYIGTGRRQSFVGGIVKTTKTEDVASDSSKKDILILGKSLIKRLDENGFRDYYIFGKKCRSVSLINEYKKRCCKYFNKKHDDIYILRANSGETYLTLTYLINALIKKNGSKNPLIVATKKYHLDMIKMICPEIPHICLEKKSIEVRINKNTFNIDNFRFFILYTHSYFRQVENDIKSKEIGQAHYFKSLLNELDLTENDIQMNKVTVPAEVEKSMLEKIEKTGLNLEKFVFLSPETYSCKTYDEDFWVLLINELQKKGYDVFMNIVDDNMKFVGALDYKSCFLTFAEAYALAKRAKKIVSLRSGLTEFLLQTGVPMDVLYTKFRHRHVFGEMDVYHVMSGFGLLQIPNVDKSKIREFNMSEVSQKDCLEEIIENIMRNLKNEEF